MLNLKFHLIKGDFRRFEGAWTMTKLPEGEGTCLLYELTVQGCLGMPVALIERRLREDLSTNLLAVEKTALQRKYRNAINSTFLLLFHMKLVTPKPQI